MAEEDADKNTPSPGEKPIEKPSKPPIAGWDAGAKAISSTL